jgi:hypothetical protein
MSESIINTYLQPKITTTLRRKISSRSYHEFENTFPVWANLPLRDKISPASGSKIPVIDRSVFKPDQTGNFSANDPKY